MGHRKTLRVWGNVMATGIAGASVDEQVESVGVLKIYDFHTRFDPRRGLLLLQSDLATLTQARKLTEDVNGAAGEQIMLVANDREFSLPSDRTTTEDLEWHTVIKICYSAPALADVLNALPDGPVIKNATKRAITRDGSGDYLYNGKLLPLNTKTLYFLIFTFLFDLPDGEATYEEIDAHLARNKKGSRETLLEMSERIRNAIKVYEKNKQLPTQIGSRKVFDTDWGKGVRLYNPEIDN